MHAIASWLTEHQTFDLSRHLANAWHEVDPSDPIREAAVRFLRCIRSAQLMRFSSRQPHACRA